MPRSLEKTNELNKKSTTKIKGENKSTKTSKESKTLKTKKADLNKSKSKVTSKKSDSKTLPKKSSLKSTTSKKSTNTLNPFVDSFEYYDLPYRYNETIVKILAQTPKTLFVYWDISDIDRKNLIKTYGKDFFEKTKPILIIHNKTKNYSFEIEINDFANSWYFNVNDEMCEYLLELGRRPKENNFYIPNNYLYIASSNNAQTPNDHILFEQNQALIYFKNIKTNEEYSKRLPDLEFLKRIRKIYNIYDMYQKIYKDENILDLNNPSSNNPTSNFS